MALITWMFAGVAAATTALAQDSPTVKIQNGTLQGVKCASTNVNAFLSIPYANPPTRFTAPEPYSQSFNGTRNATVAAPACPQFIDAFREDGPQSEDCLYLDIWVPSSAKTSNASSLPVKVWLYGGVNLAGGISDGLYDGCFAAENTIQVSVNYRVGPLGFLAYSPLNLTGNYGTQDQLLALRWVHENIASFGGDPNRVMLFGQSAGADDSWIFSSNPDSAKLIHSVVLESGTFVPLPDLAAATQGNQPFIAQMNCTDPSTGLSCLRAAPLTTLATVFQASAVGTSLTFGPVVDGTIIPSPPSHPLVPTLLGTTTREGALLVAGFTPNATSYTEADYLSWLAASFPGPANTSSPTIPAASAIASLYPPSAYTNTTPGQTLPVFNAMSAVWTDAQFRCPARRMLRSLQAATITAWTYSFGRTPSCPWYPTVPDNQAALAFLGASHTAEIPYVFGQVRGLPRPEGKCNMTEGEVALSGMMVGAWEGMARGGGPGVEGWVPWTEGTGGKGLQVLADSTWVVKEMDYEGCDFWDGIAEAQAQAGGTGGSGNGNGTGTGTGSSNATGTGAARPTASASGGGKGTVGSGMLMSVGMLCALVGLLPLGL